MGSYPLITTLAVRTIHRLGWLPGSLGTPAIRLAGAVVVVLPVDNLLRRSHLVVVPLLALKAERAVLLALGLYPGPWLTHIGCPASCSAIPLAVSRLW